MKEENDSNYNNQDSSGRQRLRWSLLAKVHMAKRDLSLSNDEYRTVLKKFEVISSADLSIGALEELLDHFKSFGWKEV